MEKMIEKDSEMDTAIKLVWDNLGIPGLNILDIGCGEGRFGYTLIKSNKNFNLYGIDIDNRSLQIAKNRGYITQNTDLDKEKLPYDSDIFDIIICLDLIEHVKNPYVLLIEINRVLKKGGLLILSTPNIQWAYHIIMLIFGYGPKTYRDSKESEYDGGHIHYFTYADIYSMLNKYGFQIIDFKGSYNICYHKMLISKILKSISKLLFYIPILRFYSCPALIYKIKKK